jgi:hypothetical protein
MLKGTIGIFGAFGFFVAILIDFLCGSRKIVGYSINCLNNAEINRYSNTIIL